MGILDRFIGKKKAEEQPAAPVAQAMPQTAAPEPTVAEKNVEAIKTVMTSIDNAVLSLAKNGVEDAEAEKYTAEFHSFRLQISGIVPKEDCTAVYDALKEVIAELSDVIDSQNTVKADETITEIRKLTTTLPTAETDLDRQKAVLQLRYIKADCVVSTMEFRILQLHSEYDQTKSEMEALIPDDMQIDKMTKFKIAQMEEKLKSINNTIGMAETSLNSLRLARQQAESTLTRLKIAPESASIHELVEQLNQEIKGIDTELGSEVEMIRQASEDAKQAFAEIKAKNMEISTALEDTSAWEESIGDEALAAITRKRQEEQAQAEAAKQAAAQPATVVQQRTQHQQTIENNQTMLTDE